MLTHNMDKFMIFSGNSNRGLAMDIIKALEPFRKKYKADYMYFDGEKAVEKPIELGNLKVGKFSDGEISVKLEDSVRGGSVFIIQSTCHPVNQNLMELLIIIDAMRRASARRITAVIPYFGYARQDRKADRRDPITAKLVSNLITTAGAD
ncbi:MAG: ribose-phosphate diphosphokinase, partial [Oscillibacter sp.]|nr:ribose-phosphate diphosphokinase [Oscillibacter sp.]